MQKKGDKITVKSATSGKTYQYVWNDSPPSGAMKDVYFAPDKSYVVAFFKQPQCSNAVDRIVDLVGVYRKRILEQTGGEYWKKIFCWQHA